MRLLRRLAAWIDALNDRIGTAIRWLVLVMVLTGAVSALARYFSRDLGLALNLTPATEAQWYLFSIVFLLGSAYGLRHGVHVRVDVLYERLGARTRAWIDLVGCSGRDGARDAPQVAVLGFRAAGAGRDESLFRGFDGDLWIEGMLTGIPGGALGFLVVVNLVVFVLGFFIDFFEIAFIIVPLVVPAARLLGIDGTWLGIVLAVNLQTSFLTPPFGFSLFYLRGVTPPEIGTTSIYRGVVPFIVIQLVVLSVLVWLTLP